MLIRCAETEADLKRCFPVVVQLRTHLSEAQFLQQVQRQMQQGYRLAFLEAGGGVKAIAGFRLLESLHKGPFLYVDDLVTDAESRSQGYGDALFDWLMDYARTHQCVSLGLDSGVHRSDAHRFYFRKRMGITSYHFNVAL